MEAVIVTLLEEVKRRITEAAVRVGRGPDEVKLVAVSKRVDPRHMLEILRAGQTTFGESYIQEALKKAQELNPVGSQEGLSQIKFHMIGHLQRNKVKNSVGFFELIHSVDRKELAEEISKVAERKGLLQKVLIQVNISGEETKSGVSPAGTLELSRLLLSLPGVSLQGFMAIGSNFSHGEAQAIRRREFREMSSLRDDISNKLGVNLPELSMGMSSDFELAVEEGATIVRVGSAIFGARPCSVLNSDGRQ